MILFIRNEKLHFFTFLFIFIWIDLSSSVTSTSSSDILNIRHGRSRVRHSTEKNHIRWGLQAFDNLTLIDYDYDSLNSTNETLYDIVANHSPMLVGDNYYLLDGSGSTSSLSSASSSSSSVALSQSASSTMSPQSINRMFTSSSTSPHKKLPKKQSMENIRKDVEEGIEYLRTHSHLLQPTATMPSEKILRKQAAASIDTLIINPSIQSKLQLKTNTMSLPRLLSSSSSITIEMHEQNSKNNDKFPSFTHSAIEKLTANGNEHRARQRDHLTQQNSKKGLNSNIEDNYFDYTAQNNDNPFHNDNNNNHEFKQNQFSTESTVNTFRMNPPLVDQDINGKYHSNDNRMDVNQSQKNRTTISSSKMQIQTNINEYSVALKSKKFNKNSNEQFEFGFKDDDLTNQNNQQKHHHISHSRSGTGVKLLVKLHTNEMPSLDTENNQNSNDDERSQFPIEIGKHFSSSSTTDKYQFNHNNNNDDQINNNIKHYPTSIESIPMPLSHSNDDAILNYQNANNELNNNNNSNTNNNNRKSNSIVNDNKNHFEPSSLLSSHDEGNDDNNNDNDNSISNDFNINISFNSDDDEDNNFDSNSNSNTMLNDIRSPIYTMNLAELDEMSETSRKNRLRMMEGKDVVTEFLQIVERSIENNCTAGTAVNLGEGVVDQYAQERFRVKADVAVNRANMLTR